MYIADIYCVYSKRVNCNQYCSSVAAVQNLHYMKQSTRNQSTDAPCTYGQ